MYHDLGGDQQHWTICIYIYALVFRVNLPSTWYGPPDPGPRHNVSELGCSRLLAFHICLLFPHLAKFLANTMQFNTTCKDYDSISQHSHQSRRTTGPQGGRGRSNAGAYILLHGLLILRPIVWLHEASIAAARTDRIEISETHVLSAGNKCIHACTWCNLKVLTELPLKRVHPGHTDSSWSKKCLPKSFNWMDANA